MELYKLIATINNIPSSFTMAYLPENFEGVKIAQSFSFVNPIGYTPKFSIDTMRIIEVDKLTIDNVFFIHGLQSDVEIEIQKLKADGTGYEYDSTFAIDFESYDIQDVYSEFALKSVSTIDFYNNSKNTEMQILLQSTATLPNTQKYINYVSLKNKGFSFSGVACIDFLANNDSKFYNNDLSLYDSVNPDSSDRVIYAFGEDGFINPFKIKSTVNIKVSGVNATFILKIVKVGAIESDIVTVFSGTVVAGGTNINTTVDFSGLIDFDANDRLIMLTNITSTSLVITGDIFVDAKCDSGIKIVEADNSVIKYELISNVLNTIFNDNLTFSGFKSDFGLTSSAHLDSLAAFATIKPKEFVSDLCLAMGYMLNFKIDGSVQIGSISTIFDTLLDVDNAIEITDFKDVSIRYNTELNFSSVSVGQQISEYDVYSYLIDWNKVLTFMQADRKAIENLDLSLTKYRTDFSGIIDYFAKRSQQKTSVSKDNFIFNADFDLVPDADVNLYDATTPRDILKNWSKFLSFCFQNFSLDTLEISSNGGSSDNLVILGTAQMNDFVLGEDLRLLPIEYTLTCLIDDVDFSESILKINHDGEDVYLFVIDSETTDKLTEQTIKGLKIQF